MANSSLLATSECLKRLRRAVPIILSNQATHRSFDDPNYIYWHPFLILKGKIGFCSLSGADGVTDEFIDETLFKFDALFREFDICASIMRSVDMQTDEAIEAFRVSSKKFGEMWRTAFAPRPRVAASNPPGQAQHRRALPLPRSRGKRADSGARSSLPFPVGRQLGHAAASSSPGLKG